MSKMSTGMTPLVVLDCITPRMPSRYSQGSGPHGDMSFSFAEMAECSPPYTWIPIISLPKRILSLLLSEGLISKNPQSCADIRNPLTRYSMPENTKDSPQRCDQPHFDLFSVL